MANNPLITSLRGKRLGLDRENNLLVENSSWVATTTITSAQLLALNATEQEVVPAPPSGYAIVPRLMVLRKPAGTAYAGVGAGEDLVLKWTDDSGDEACGHVETTGFLDQTTEQLRAVGIIGASGSVADVSPVDNAAVVLHLLGGEVTTGDSDLYVRVYYDVINTAFS